MMKQTLSALVIIFIVASMQILNAQQSNIQKETTTAIQDSTNENARAVTDHGSGFIFLESGNKKDGRVERIDEPYGRSYLLLNGNERYNLSSVRAYEDEDGYFAKLYDNPWGSEFVRRVSEGKIDLFATTEWAVISGPTRAIPTFGGPVFVRHRRLIAVDNVSYFSKNGIDVLAINYDNLSGALADNSASMKCLKEYRNLEIWQWALLGAGTVMAIVGLSTMHQDDQQLSPLAAAGCLVAASSWIPYSMKGPKLQLAIDLYNQ